MVSNVAGGTQLRKQVAAQSSASGTRSVGRSRVARGMESARAKRLANTAGEQFSWRDGWDVEYMRFGVRKTCDEHSGDGEEWSVIDFWSLSVLAVSKTKNVAQLIADSLEYLQDNTEVDEFARALP